jgi:tetratricopeptide (TPR) repeat protein/transcriptional regulator with XRE-family HTH domain
MLDQGFTIEQIAYAIMAKGHYRPRQAWRHAHGWTQEELAHRYNQVINDPGSPVTYKHISDYENWPPGNRKPTLTFLRNLARLFGTVEWKLVDFDDLSRMNSHERAALRPPRGPSSIEQSLEIPSEYPRTESAHSNPATLPRAVGQKEQLIDESQRALLSPTISRDASQAEDRIIPHQLPPPVRHFTGRDEELTYLSRSSLVSNSDVNRPIAVLVCGPPGVGKTALVIEWANRFRNRFRDGQLYADFHGFDMVRPASDGEIFDNFLRDLGVPPARLPGTLAAQQSLYRSLIGNKRILVILDNVESAESVRAFLTGTNTVVIVTSRSRLPGLEVRDSVCSMTLDTLHPDASVDLLKKIIGSTRVEADLASARELARLCGYLPLALCIAAQQVAIAQYAPIGVHVRYLSKEDEILGELTLEDDERATVSAVFSWSYKKLNTAAARVFRMLGINPCRDISLDSAAAMCGLDITDARRIFRTFVSMNLLREIRARSYRLHGLIRAYASDLARKEEAMEDQTAATRQLVRWYVATAENANKLLTPGGVPRSDVEETPGGEEFASFDDALRWLDDERANLIDIIRRASDIGDYRSAAIIPDLLDTYFYFTKRWADWITCNELGLVSARAAGDAGTEAYLLMSQGVVYRHLRQYPQAQEYFESALQMFEQLGDSLGLAYVLQNLAGAQGRAGQLEQALPNFHRALEVFDTLPDSRRGRAISLRNMAEAFDIAHRYEEAINAAREALDLSREIDDAQGAASALNYLGIAFAGLSRNHEALESHQEALQIQQDIKDRYGEARTRYAIGQIAAAEGRAGEAEIQYTQALEIFSELNAPEVAEAAGGLESLRRKS